jgi:lysozyme
MASNVLKEFLVKIRYDVDEQSYKNYSNKLAAISKGVESLGKISVIAGGALSAFLLKTASEMEKLYFAAQRAGTTVSSLMGIRFAAEQIGISAEAATAMVTGLAGAIRSNPGMMLFFKQLGLKDTGDNTKNLVSLVSKLKGMSDQGPFGHAIAAQIASKFGIDEQTLYMMEKHLPELLKAQKELKDTYALAGVDPQEQSEKFHQFMEDVRTLLMKVETLAVIFGGQLLPWAEKFVHFMIRAADYMLKMHKASGGISTALAGVATVAGGGAAAKASVGWLLRSLLGTGGGAVAAAEGGVAAGAEAAGGGILAAVGGIPAILAIVAVVATIAVGWLAYHYRDKLGGAASAVGSGIMGLIGSLEGKSKKVYRDIAGHLTVGYGHKVLPGEDFSGGVTEDQATNLLARDVATASKAVQRLVHVALNKNQLAALTDFAYNVGATGFAHSSVLRDVNAGNFAGAANDFLKYTRAGGVSGSKGMMNRRLGEKALFQKPDVSMNQQTTIHVQGDDPRATANLVAQHQRSVNGDIVRDMAAKVT